MLPPVGHRLGGMTTRSPEPPAGAERRRLSSSLTFPLKFIFPPVFAVAYFVPGLFPLSELRAGATVS